MTEQNSEELYFEWWLKDLQKLGLVIDYWREGERNQFKVHDAIPIFYDHYYAKKPKITKSFTLFNPKSYTCDYLVRFSPQMFNVLFGIINEKNMLEYGQEDLDQAGNVYERTLCYGTLASRITDPEGEVLAYDIWFDVKPPMRAGNGGKLDSYITFPFAQRMVYEHHFIYVNKVVPVGHEQCWFAKTFTPQRYLYTDGGEKIRKLTKEKKVKGVKTGEQVPKWNVRSLDEYLMLKGIIPPIKK